MIGFIEDLVPSQNSTSRYWWSRASDSKSGYFFPTIVAITLQSSGEPSKTWEQLLPTENSKLFVSSQIAAVFSLTNWETAFQRHGVPCKKWLQAKQSAWSWMGLINRPFILNQWWKLINTLIEMLSPYKMTSHIYGSLAVFHTFYNGL